MFSDENNGKLQELQRKMRLLLVKPIKNNIKNHSYAKIVIKKPNINIKYKKISTGSWAVLGEKVSSSTYLHTILNTKQFQTQHWYKKYKHTGQTT